MKKEILIVEDEFIVASDLQLILERAGYEVCGIAASVEEAMALLVHKPALVFLDIKLSGHLNGIDLAIRLNEMEVPFIFVSANFDEGILKLARSTNPYGFLVKPFRKNDVLVTLDIAIYRHEHNHEAKLLRLAPVKAAGSTENTTPQLIGSSHCLDAVKRQIEIVAPFDMSVLILGESGTGKERVAESIHRLSERSAHPFIKINCAAIPAALMESELFGHEKGAYTGAVTRRIGKFEQAIGGTVFLDEIGELSADLQSKLLCVLQEKEIVRLGSNKTIKTDFRVIAATNRNLEKEVANGNFRLDLYYRLKVFPIDVPPLRERKEDIKELVYYFLDRISKRLNKNVSSVSDHMMRVFMDYEWPGNIRELENLIERSVVLTNGDVLIDIDIPRPSFNEPVYVTNDSRIKTMREVESEHILAVLKKCNEKINGAGGAAELLDMPPTTLLTKMNKLGITKKFTTD